jgi:ribonuclease HIII
LETQFNDRERARAAFDGGRAPASQHSAAWSQPDTQVRRYWEAAGADVELARNVVGLALAEPPTTPKVLARALTVARRADAHGFDTQIESALVEPLARARKLLALIDVLGDEAVDVDRAVFDHLVEWVAEQNLAGVDLRPLAQARRGAASRPHAARALLEAIGWERLGDDFACILRPVITAAVRSTYSHHARVLVVTPDHEAGLALGINVRDGDRPGVTAADEVDLAMNKQAATVLSAIEAERNGVRWSLEWPLRYAGESIGLALALAALVSFKGLRPDPLLAATGAVADDGHVRPVVGIPAKLAAAREAGFRRVLLPRENQEEALATVLGDDLQLLFVDHVDEIVGRLHEVTVADELSFDGRVRQARAALTLYGLSLKEEKSTAHSRQLVVTDAVGRAILEVWSTGKVTASGPRGATRDRVELLIAELFVGDAAEEREPHSFMLADAWRKDRLHESLEREGAQAREAKGNGELWRYALRRKSSEALVTMWTSGKGRLTGKAPAFDEVLSLIASAQEGLANVDAVAKPKVRGPAGGSNPAELPAEGPWIGTDESGKGDYFGPLVSAAVFADDEVAERLRAIGVQDSKQLTDKRVRALAPLVRQTVGKGRFKVTPINPARYNALYADFKAEGKNLNSLLAWGHTRSIEELLAGGLHPRYAIVDQFADGRYIRERLMTEARQSGLVVFQFPKAETNLAVAAASIIAREAFLDWLDRTSAKMGLTLPKGASPQVVEAARRIVASGGHAALAEVAKLHFKTTEKVMAA